MQAASKPRGRRFARAAHFPRTLAQLSLADAGKFGLDQKQDPFKILAIGLGDLHHLSIDSFNHGTPSFLFSSTIVADYFAIYSAHVPRKTVENPVENVHNICDTP